MFSQHEQLAMYREGQSRGRPKRAEHGRTVVRIAAPASVLQPRPRSTVHDFRALPVLFFPRSSQRNKKRKEEKQGRYPFSRRRRVLPVQREKVIDRQHSREEVVEKNYGRFSGGSVFPPLFVAGKMAAVTIPSFPRNSELEFLVQWARTNEQRTLSCKERQREQVNGFELLFIMRHIDLAASWTVVREMVVVSMASR